MTHPLITLRFLAGAFVAWCLSSLSVHGDVLLSHPFGSTTAPLKAVSGWYEGAPLFGDPTDSERNLRVENGEMLWDGFPSEVNTVLCRRMYEQRRPSGPVYYVGFVLTVESTPSRSGIITPDFAGRPFFAFSNTTGRSLRGHLGVVYGTMPGNYRLSLGNQAHVSQADIIPVDLLAGENVRVVIAYDTHLNTATLWVNPSGRPDEPGLRTTEPATPATLNAIAFRMRNNGKEDLGSMRISRLVVATTLANAMPSVR